MSRGGGPERLFAGLRPPAPPAELGRAVAALAAAGAQPPTDPWARWWTPAARLAWGAAIVLLLAAHWLLPASRGWPPRSGPPVSAIELPELALPPIDAAALERVRRPGAARFDRLGSAPESAG